MAERGAGGKFVKKAQAQGVGESRIFVAPEGSFPPGTVDWSTLTVAGKPIPEHLWGLVPYAQTDQGRAENNEGKQERAAEIVRTEESKRIERFRDFQFDGAEPGMGDPMKELVDQHVQPGQHPRFLSPRSFPVHGTRGYEKVLDSEGNPVMFGDMYLGVIPQDEAIKREKRDAALARQMMVDAQDTVREQTEQIMSERDMRSLARRRGTLEYVAGMQSEDGEELRHEFLVGQ